MFVLLLIIALVFVIAKLSGERDYQRRKEDLLTRINRENQHMVEKEHLREEVRELKRVAQVRMPPQWDDNLPY